MSLRQVVQELQIGGTSAIFDCVAFFKPPVILTFLANGHSSISDA
jgi:hypothetical protein